MPGTSPIRLGSAVSGWTFESGSNVETSPSGIQSCSVKALWPIGGSVLSNLPAPGSSVSTITPFIPPSFLLDYTGGGPAVEYLEGTVARATLKYVRPDPNASGPTNSRKVSVDTIINYKSVLSPYFDYALAASGETGDGIFGFPEPVCTVTYNTTTQPGIGSGGLASIYVQTAPGFPEIPSINVPYVRIFSAGSVLTYFDGTAYVSVGPLVAQSTFTWTIDFIPNPRGWQLQKLSYEPLSAANFYDVKEIWRIFYFFQGVTFISAIPAP